MALRNQPYFPLYVQDYLTDEKLNMCSWSTQGIYIKILCVLHKQENYGCILFKQTIKQNMSMIENFAYILVKNLPCQINEMIIALNELIEYNVLTISDNKLYQKRMVKDGEISEKRSNSAKKGGGNPILFKQTDKQIDKQITENEYENINNNIGVKKNENSPEEIHNSKLSLLMNIESLRETMKNDQYLLQVIENSLKMNKDNIKVKIDQFIKEKALDLHKNYGEISSHFQNWVKKNPDIKSVNKSRFVKNYDDLS